MKSLQTVLIAAAVFAALPIAEAQTEWEIQPAPKDRTVPENMDRARGCYNEKDAEAIVERIQEDGWDAGTRLFLQYSKGSKGEGPKCKELDDGDTSPECVSAEHSVNDHHKEEKVALWIIREKIISPDNEPDQIYVFTGEETGIRQCFVST